MVVARTRNTILALSTAVLAAFVVAGLDRLGGGDQWFELTLSNDTRSAVVLREPCPNCRPSAPEFLARIAPGASYRIPVLANGGLKTYVVSDEAGVILACLPLAYSSVPAVRVIALSLGEAPCAR